MRPGLLALTSLLTTVHALAAPPPHVRVALPNGLVVLAVEDRSSTIAAVHLGVRTGVGSAEAMKPGMAALVQQVNQQRLEARLADERWTALRDEVAGRGDLGLNTEVAYCEARAQVTNARLDAALELVGSVMFDRQSISQDECLKARDALLAASGSAVQRVTEVTYYRFLEALFGRGSALAQPIWGGERALREVAAADANGFASACLGPNNASICVVGPRQPQELVAAVRRAMAQYRPTRLTLHTRTVKVGSGSRVSAGVLPGWRGASLVVGVPAPDYGSRGFVVAQLVYVMLSGPTGRLTTDPAVGELLGLNRVLERTQGEGPVSPLPVVPGPRPYIAAHVFAQPRQLEAARQLVLGHLLEFATKAPPEAELRRAKMRLTNAAAIAEMTQVNLAKSYNSYELFGANPEQAWKLQDAILSITGREVVAMAKTWFGRHAIGVVMPGDDQ